MNRYLFWALVVVGVLAVIAVGSAVYFGATAGDAQWPR